MKLKQWLREYHNMTYLEYKALPEEGQLPLKNEFTSFNRSIQIANSGGVVRRKMTGEEKIELDRVLEKERKRYEYSLKCGGIDERGNYTALSHRWWNT